MILFEHRSAFDVCRASPVETGVSAWRACCPGAPPDAYRVLDIEARKCRSGVSRFKKERAVFHLIARKVLPSLQAAIIIGANSTLFSYESEATEFLEIGCSIVLKAFAGERGGQRKHGHSCPKKFNRRPPSKSVSRRFQL